ncbi:unnamed protein product [Schistocephalus solidus]|uniref:GIY-YIG domain-containing protein n=1 Tax=Schistocephalus solidus TaxID=70667 RepID=A0A183TLW5_SCHSO|nr:unnamed protein product [Schistocephalus solidus]
MLRLSSTVEATTRQLTKEAASELCSTGITVTATAIISLKKSLLTYLGCFGVTGIRLILQRTASGARHNRKAPPQNGVIVARKLYSLPYMKGASGLIARQLNRAGRHVAHKPASSLRTTLSRIKDPIPKNQLTNVIYRITCANCSCVHIGHTGRRLGTRINEHKLAVRRRDPLSLVFAHVVECDHRFNWDETEVVAMANTKGARGFLQAWYSCVVRRVRGG